MKRICVFVFFFCVSSAALALPCANPAEAEAIRIRALQTELMFGALSCNGKTHYNRFVQHYRQELKAEATTLRGYFDRHFGRNAENEMNHFITRLANDASTRSLKTGLPAYCENAREWFASVEDAEELGQVRYRYRGNIRTCR